MNRIERYLAQVVISYTLLVMLVMLIILGFFEFMNQVTKLTESYTLEQGLLYTLLKLPVYSYEVFPIVLVIGTLMGLGSLANQSELVILRVTGWSIKRILVAVLKATLPMWIVIAMIGEWVAPNSESYAKKMRAEALHKDLSIGSKKGLWFKEGYRYIHVNRIISSTQLRGITIYNVGTSGLTTLTEVEVVNYENNHWVFKNIDLLRLEFVKNYTYKLVLPDKLEIQQSSLKKLSETFPLKPEDLQNLDIETRYLSIVDLYQYIQFLQANNLESGVYELEFWRKASMPLVIIAMVAIVFPLIFGSIRQVSMGQRTFIGVLLGMGFYLLNQLVGNLSIVYNGSIIIGALFPTTIVLVITLIWLQRVR